MLVPEGFRTTTADNGDLLIYPEGDLSVPPSGKMPAGGFFFDSIIRQEPIDEARLDPRDNLEEFSPDSDADLAFLKQSVEEAPGDRGAVVANFGGTGIGDIALVPGTFHEAPPRDPRRDRVVHLDCHADRTTFTRSSTGRRRLPSRTSLGSTRRSVTAVDVVFICGTDFGAQNTQFCSPETFDSLYAPYYRRMNSWIHEHTSWKTFKHSCGAIAPLLAHMIDAGFDIINPVQLSAAGMDPAAAEEAPRRADRVLGRRRGHAEDPAFRNSRGRAEGSAGPLQDPGQGRRVRLQPRAQRAGPHAHRQRRRDDRCRARVQRGEAGMTGRERVLSVLSGTKADSIPLMPITMMAGG